MKKALLLVLLLTHITLPIFGQSSHTTVPAKIEAESYSSISGTGTSETSDSGGGLEISWMGDNSSVTYAVYNPVAQYYTFYFRIANGFSDNASIQIKNEAGDLLKEIAVPRTGGMQSWRTIQTPVFLPYGNQTIQIFAKKGIFSLNWFQIYDSNRTVPGKIEAEDFVEAYQVNTETTADSDGNLNVSYIDDGDWMDYNITVPETGSYQFNFRVANSYGNGIIEVKDQNLTTIGTVNIPQTGGWQSWKTVTTTANLTSGNQILRIYTPKGTFNFNWFEIKKEIPPLTPAISYIPIPSKIEAEAYSAMSGIGIGPTADEGGGQEVGWIGDGGSMSYPISNANAQFYTFRFRIANGFSGDAVLQVRDGNDVIVKEITVPLTGGMQSWKTVQSLIYLPQGNQNLKIVAKKGIFSLNWFDIIKSDKPVPAKIEAENFEASYGVNTESTTDNNGGLNVSYIDDADWMDYNLTVPSQGNYVFHFRVANSYGNGSIEIQNQSGSVLGSIAVPQTGGWQNWTTVSTPASLPPGNQVLRIYAKRGAFNLNWFDIASESNLAASTLVFEPLTEKTLADASFQLNATSNNTESEIIYSSSNPGIVSVAKVSGSWRATPVAEGTATITASQSGSVNFNPAAPVSQTITIRAAPSVALGQKINLDPSRWYQLNNATYGLEALFDGETFTNVHTGWGKVLETYDAYYPLHEGEQMTLQGIKMFDYEGIFTDKPMIISVITDQWQRIPVATFTGSSYGAWVGPYPDRPITGDGKFLLDAPVGNIRYLVLTLQSGMPTELELYGTHTPSSQQTTPAPAKAVKLKDMFGVNAYEWNFQDGNTPWVINESKMEMVKSFSGIRHYMDWEKLESQEGVYSFNPTLMGGWHYDQIYERCKQEGIEVLACLKSLPGWMLSSYPADARDHENVPVRYGSDFSNPASYIEQARIGFQYAARYGSNTAVDPALLSVYSTPRWPGDNPNTIRIGTGLVRYIECDNERDKWWKGRKGYQTAREYAANLSAFYDGHKNTMGPGIGIKNADPSMKVVIAGLVTGPDYIKGMVDWCKEFRGYKPDGTVNLCWDIVNFHMYTDNTSSSQSGTSTRGAAPEVTIANQIVEKFIQTTHDVSYDMPVWITETGFDVHQDSPLKAIPIGSKSALDTQADWILRTALFSARHKIEKVFFYQIYDDNATGAIFGSSGLVNSDLTRRPAADFLYQTNKLFGEYTFKETIHNDPIIDRYELNGNSMYMLVVPDETGRTASYTLQLPGFSTASVYTPIAGSQNMARQDLNFADGNLTLTVGETPLFVVPGSAASARLSYENTEITSSELVEEEVTDVIVYPNPSSDYVLVTLPTGSASGVELNLFSGGSGYLYKQLKNPVMSVKQPLKIDISTLPEGVYVMEIRKGQQHFFRKIIKK